MAAAACVAASLQAMNAATAHAASAPRIAGPRRGRARFVGVDRLETEECVYALLDWSHGNFTFSEQAIDCEDELDTSTSALLLEAARRMDEPPS